MEKFSQRLRRLRKDKNNTLEELAEILNTTKTTLSRYENCERVPNVDFIILTCKYFNCSADYLLGLSDLYAPLKQNLDMRELSDLISDVQQKINDTRHKIIHKGQLLSDSEIETLESIIIVAMEVIKRKIENKK